MTSQETPALCVSCNSIVTGPYCSACGEAVLDEEALTLRGFLLGSVRILLDFEHGLWPSVKLLVTKPGFLTREYLAGRRVGYVKPLRLFLMINVLYFLVQPQLLSNTYNTRLNGHMHRQVYSPLVEPLVIKTITERGVDLDSYTEKFDAVSARMASTLVVILVPIFSLATGLLFWRRKIPAVGHLVFSLHFLGYYLLVGSVGLGALMRVVYVVFNKYDMDDTMVLNELNLTFIMFAISVAFLWPAIRRVFGVGNLGAMGTASIFGLFFFPMVFFYRYLLFWLVWLVV